MVSLYELQHAKETEMDEWMYQISVDDKADPLAPWKAVWGHLGDAHAARGPAEGRYGAALAALSDVLDAHPWRRGWSGRWRGGRGAARGP